MGVVCGGRYFLYGGTPQDLHFADLSSFESTGVHPHYFYPAYDFWVRARPHVAWSESVVGWGPSLIYSLPPLCCFFFFCLLTPVV